MMLLAAVDFLMSRRNSSPADNLRSRRRRLLCYGRNLGLIAVFCLWSLPCGSEAAAKKITVLFTGESHASFYPCSCPKAPYGGIARRATMLKNIREETGGLLLVDAGGALAGGVYDEHSQGEAEEKARSLLYLRAMAKMGYAALAVGDEELGFGIDFLRQAAGSIPLLSANLVDASTGKLIFTPYIIKKISGVSVAIIGLTTPEAKTQLIKQRLTQLKIADPVAALQTLMPKVSPKAKIIIVLSHLGEKVSKELVRKVPGIHLLINGHRKSTQEVAELVGKTLIGYFSYQARRLGRVDLELDAQGHIKKYTPSHIDLSEEVPDDADMEALLADYQPPASQAKIVLELYLPLASPQSKIFTDLAVDVSAKLGENLEWRLYLIPSSSQMRSPKALQEEAEAEIKLLIHELWPDKLWAYISCRDQAISGTSWEVCAGKLRLNIRQLKSELSSGRGRKLLSAGADQARRVNLRSLPALFVNHDLYRGEPEAQHLLRWVCAEMSGSQYMKVCRELPECVDDLDCQKVGHEGLCRNPGAPQAVCEYTEAPEIPLTIVYSEKGLYFVKELHPRLTHLFPNLQATFVEEHSPEGQRLIKDYRIEILPAYLFGKQILQAKHLDEIKPDLAYRRPEKSARDKSGRQKSEGRFLNVLGANYYLKRPYKPNKVEYIFSASMPVGYQVLLDVYEQSGRKIPDYFGIRYFVAQDEQGNILARAGQAEVEEDLRQLAIQKLYPDKFIPYLRLRMNQIKSSYWEDSLLAVGLNPQEIKAASNKPEIRDRLAEDAAYLKGLQLPEINNAPLFLINNQELLLIQSKDQFLDILKKLKGSL